MKSDGTSRLSGVLQDQSALYGVQFEQYPDGPETDEKGIFCGSVRNLSPDIAWFKDPTGNTLSIIGQP
jgi:hypothetical protein